MCQATPWEPNDAPLPRFLRCAVGFESVSTARAGALSEHTFVTSEGHAYARFRRALDSRSATAALSAASELEHVGLADALELCLLVRDREPKRFERAALRWHGRYCREVADVTLEEAQAVLALLGGLKGQRAPAAARALAELFDRRLLLQASEALVRWADGR